MDRLRSCLLRHIGDTGQGFNRAKRTAIAGLTVGFLLWLVGFMAVGGEWFGMWMSQQWNGVPSAFRYLMVTLGVVDLPQPARPRPLERPLRGDLDRVELCVRSPPAENWRVRNGRHQSLWTN